MGQNPKLQIGIVIALIVVLLLSTSWVSTQANPGSVVDFEGIPEGTIVDTLSWGFGVSGDFVSGSIAVHGLSPAFDPDQNAMMIFDSACLPAGTPAGCTGGDPDLFHPEVGNVAIISEDLDTSDPDDGDLVGSFFEFDYSGFGSGTVTVESIQVLDVEDIEGGAQIFVYSGGINGTLLAVVDIPFTGDGGIETVPVNISGVDFMRVTLNGSGAITNVTVEAENVPTATPPTLTPTEPTAVKLLYFRVEGVNGQGDLILAHGCRNRPLRVQSLPLSGGGFRPCQPGPLRASQPGSWG
jgi:hypothetical protein